jgi:hypothetical protein
MELYRKEMVPKCDELSLVHVAPKFFDLSTQPLFPAAIATPDPSSARDTPYSVSPLQRELVMEDCQEAPELLV